MKRKSRKTTSKFCPRIRFNWGFHDAASDCRNGQLRALVMGGEQTPKIVSFTFDPDYYRGYDKGREFARSGLPTDSSEPAWEQMLAAGIYKQRDADF